MGLKDKLKMIREGEGKKIESQDLKRNKWQSLIRRLYEKLENWLEEYIDEGLIKIDYRRKEIQEEFLGEYAVLRLILKISSTKSIILDPVGRNVVGSNGRIDFYLKGAKVPRLMILLFEDGTDSKWEIWSPKGKSDSIDLNRLNFEKIIETWLEY